MNKILRILIVFCLFIMAGCTSKGDVEPDKYEITEVPVQENDIEEPIEAETEKNDPVNNEPHGMSWVDGALKENITDDMVLSAKDDFHLYVNYDWLKNTEIPDGHSTWSFFDEISGSIEKKKRALISDESMVGHDVELIRDFYHEILDWDERNARGIEPMMDLIGNIQSVQTLEELTELICDREKGRYLPTFIEASVNPSRIDSSRYIVEIKTRQHYNGISTRLSVYNPTEEKKLFARMMERAGFTQIEAAQMYDSAMNDVERYLLFYPSQYEDSSSPDFYEKNSVIMTKKEIEGLTSVFPLMRILESQGYGISEEFQVFCPKLFENLDTIYSEDMLEKLKQYLMVYGVMKMTPILDQEANGIYTNYKHKVFGIQGSLSDEENALAIVEEKLTTPLCRAYIQKYDASDLKERTINLVKQIVDEYNEMLKEEDWLSEETRKCAIEKLDSMKINAIYPDEWEDYSLPELKGMSFWDAMIMIDDYDSKRMISRIDTPVNEYELKMSPLETNAYYDLQENSINVLLGIMSGELYYDGISEEELYAGIGTIIGHEISHAFDTKGALYDKNGDYSNWWTQEDYEIFQKRADKLISYFESLPAGQTEPVWSNVKVNGKKISGEAIADITGMKVILRLVEKKENFDFVKFFTFYAKHWRILSSKEAESNLLLSDDHPLNYLRTNVTLQQFDKFFEVFDIREEDKMFLAKDERVCVW